MRITKEDLKNIKKVGFGLENCEDFDFDVKDILDINFENITQEKIKDCRGKVSIDNKVYDGKIVISKNAFKILSSMAHEEFEDGTAPLDVQPKEEFFFINRIRGCCDVCQVLIEFKDDSDLLIYVPYDPLESSITGGELEYSNCPSCEINKNGDLEIFFGKSSKAPKREDNNYFDIIHYLNKKIKLEKDEILEVKLEEINNHEGALLEEIMLDCKTSNKKFKDIELDLHFYDVKDIKFQSYFEEKKRKHELRVSKMLDGNIFVQIGCFMNFSCSAIEDISSLYDEFEEDTCEEDAMYLKGLKCELKEEEMRYIAYNHFAWNKDIKEDYIKCAFNKILNNEISLQYFKFWLKFTFELLEVYDGKNFNNHKSSTNVAKQLNLLYLKLFYEKDLNKVIETITNTKQILNTIF